MPQTLSLDETDDEGAGPGRRATLDPRLLDPVEAETAEGLGPALAEGATDAGCTALLSPRWCRCALHD
jgi:hypothetical protein